MRATIHPDRGGRLGQLAVGGRPLLADHRPGPNAWAMWGAYVLAPWSNRIAAGQFRFEGRTWTMPDHFDDGTAIHGLVHSCPWSVADTGPDRASMRTRVDVPPWRLTLHQQYELAAGSLRHELAMTNGGDQSVPVGLGVHPWFRAGEVRVPASLRWPADRCIPTGSPEPVGGAFDLRDRRLPPAMDECFTGLTGTSADVGPVRIEWEGPITQVVVFTGEPGWVCVEPVTNVNDGFNLFDRGVDGTGVIVLAAGADVSIAITYRWPDQLSAQPAGGAGTP